MQEVTVRICFNRACLGSSKRRKGKDVIYVMERAPDGRVMFMPSAWLGVMRYAAKLANRHHNLVKQIDWDPRIDSGTLVPNWRRTIVTNKQGGKSHYAVHEAFAPGAIVAVNAVLPDGLGIEDFWRLLDVVGTYKGFSPYNNDSEKYGTFEVSSIQPRSRPWVAQEEPAEEMSAKGEPPGG